MGGDKPKQLMRYRGETLVRRAVQVAQEVPVDQVIVVVGNVADRVIREVQDQGVTVVLNEAWNEGLSTSVRGGLAAVEHDVRGVFIYPADMPLINADMLRELMRRQQAGGRPAAMSEVNGVRGVPVFVTRTVFSGLMIQEGDAGGAQYLRAHLDLVETVHFDDPMLTLDVDSPDDFQRLLENDPDYDPDAAPAASG